jgi:hypothetical protein
MALGDNDNTIELSKLLEIRQVGRRGRECPPKGSAELKPI